MPFWVMQATEIAVALVFAYLSVHVAHGGLLVISAVPLVVLAVTAQGPLGVFHLCSQRLHLLAGHGPVAPSSPWRRSSPSLRPDIQGIIVLEFGAVGLFRVATLTRAGETRPAVRPGPRGRSRVIDTTATVVEAGSSTPAPGSGPAPTADGTSVALHPVPPPDGRDGPAGRRWPRGSAWPPTTVPRPKNRSSGPSGGSGSGPDGRPPASLRPKTPGPAETAGADSAHRPPRSVIDG